MKIKDFLDSKTIYLKELNDNFTEIKRLELDTQLAFKKCYNCNDTCNQYAYISESWLHSFYCVKCTTINAVIFSDRMGGNCNDTIIIYKEK